MRSQGRDHGARWECKKCKWNNNDDETKCKICKLSRF